MGKFLVTSGTSFKPFTYQELAAPVEQAAQLHRETQDVYDTLGMETAALQNYINQENDPESYAMYQNYLNNLQALQDNLWANGYSTQTRRDLAAARNGYASDIARLQKAITNRQERSKEYWDTWHQNPDLVRGEDPGLASLDKYVKDDLYGNNYYSYSGNDFIKEVAAEAEARKSELLRNPEILKQGNVPGYITRLITTGFTNSEVDTAYEAIKTALFSGENGSISPEMINPMIAGLEKLDDNSAILARVLADQLESTGAYGNLDKKQLLRLLDYGKKGLSAAVGKPDIKDFDDKYFDQQLDLDTYTKKKIIDKTLDDAGGAGQLGLSGATRSFNRLVSENAAKMSSFIGKNFVDKYSDGNGRIVPVELKLTDGTRVSATDAAEMSSYIYNTGPRLDVMEKFDGLDLALPGYNKFWPSTKSKQQSEHNHFMTTNLSDAKRYMTEEEKANLKNLGLTDDDVFILQYNNGWHYNESGTTYYNAALADHNSEIQKIRELNLADLGKDIYDYAMSPRDLQKTKEKYHLEDVADVDVPVALKRMAVDELDVAPTIVSSDPADDAKRKLFARLIDDFWGAFSAQGLLGKSSQGAFYKISGGGGYASGAKGEGNKANIFKLDSYGRIDPGCITSIMLMPRDIGGKEGTRFRIRVTDQETGNSSDWEMDSYALGENLGAALNDIEFVEDITNALRPFNDAVGMLSESDEDSVLWANDMYDFLGIDQATASTRYPMTSSGPVNAKDIIRNDNYYSTYYDAIVDFIQRYINLSISGLPTKK